jgi:hypothetical protein
LIFEETCPDGRLHRLDLYFASLCDSSATATLPYIAQTLLTRIDVFGPAHQCAGDTALLMAAEGMSSYHWSTGDTTRSIRVSSPGVYSVATVDSNGCSLSSETVKITTARKPVIKPNGHVTVCAGDSVTLDGGAEYASYLWSNGAVTRRVTVACEGVYTVNVTGYDGCAATADSVRTVAAPRPPKPVITRSVDELSTQTADSCQWLLDGVEITGATQRTITASGTGVYCVRVKNEYGCTAESDDYPVTVLDAGAAAHDPLVELVLYPDPVSDALVISRSGAGRAVEIAIFDMLGRLRFAGGIPEGTARITVETAAWTPGPYLLHARSGENITVRMFMKRGAVGGFR